MEDLKQQYEELIKACKEKQQPIPQTKKRNTSFRRPYQTLQGGQRKSRRKLPTSREEAERNKKEKEEQEQEAQPLADEKEEQETEPLADDAGGPNALLDDDEIFDDSPYQMSWVAAEILGSATCNPSAWDPTLRVNYMPYQALLCSAILLPENEENICK